MRGLVAGRRGFFAVVLSCIPVADAFICQQRPEAPVGSYERRESSPRDVTAAQVMDLLKDHVMIINGRLENLEVKTGLLKARKAR